MTNDNSLKPTDASVAKSKSRKRSKKAGSAAISGQDRHAISFTVIHALELLVDDVRCVVVEVDDAVRRALPDLSDEERAQCVVEACLDGNYDNDDEDQEPLYKSRCGQEEWHQEVVKPLSFEFMEVKKTELIPDEKTH